MDDCQKMWGLEKRRKICETSNYIHFIFRLIGQILKIWYFKFLKIKFKCWITWRTELKKGKKAKIVFWIQQKKKNHIYEHIRCWNFGVKLLNNTSVGDDDRLKRELEAFFSVCVGCKYPESKSKKNTRFFREIDFTEKIFIFSM